MYDYVAKKRKKQTRQLIDSLTNGIKRGSRRRSTDMKLAGLPSYPDKNRRMSAMTPAEISRPKKGLKPSHSVDNLCYLTNKSPAPAEIKKDQQQFDFQTPGKLKPSFGTNTELEVIKESKEDVDGQQGDDHAGSVNPNSNQQICYSSRGKKENFQSNVNSLRSGLLNLYSKAKSNGKRPSEIEDGLTPSRRDKRNSSDKGKKSDGFFRADPNLVAVDANEPIISKSRNPGDNNALTRSTRARPSIFKSVDLPKGSYRKPKPEDMKLDTKNVCIKLEEHFKIHDWKILKKYYTGNPEFSDCT